MTIDARGTAVSGLSLVRLLHLMSPSLPTGGFAYSQGLEWAVEAGWVGNARALESWLSDMLSFSLARTDIPVIRQIYQGVADGCIETCGYWIDLLLSMRETRELYEEEKVRGRAVAAILGKFDIPGFDVWEGVIKKSQTAGFAYAGAAWQIPLSDLCTAYAWAWLENQVMAGIKLIPLGQSQGHQLLFAMDPVIHGAVARGLELETCDIGAAMPAMAIGSCLHEHQYTRLFRS